MVPADGDGVASSASHSGVDPALVEADASARSNGASSASAASSVSLSLLPPAPTPRPVFTGSSEIDLYNLANWLFLIAGMGYLLADACRVAWPVHTIKEARGSNATNGAFFFFAALYVVDCTLYFLVYNRWEREALAEAREARRLRGEPEDDDDEEGGDDDYVHGGEPEADDGAHRRRGRPAHDEESRLSHEAASDAPSASGDGTARRRTNVTSRRQSLAAAADSGPLTARLAARSRAVARRARWCFFSHEGGLVNTLEIVAALIFLVDAAMSFFAGIAEVGTRKQRLVDAATMTGDTAASAIFLFDSLVFHHLYVRTLQPNTEEERRHSIGVGPTRIGFPSSSPPSPPAPLPPASVSCVQPLDPYFWTSILNVLGSLLYTIASAWGMARQRVIARMDDQQPGSYDDLMLPMLELLHTLFLFGDILYVLCGATLVYAYWRDPASKDDAEPVFDPDGKTVLGESSAFQRNK